MNGGEPDARPSGYAVLVGIEQYPQSGLESLPGAALDAAKLAQLLIETGEVPRENVRLFLNFADVRSKTATGAILDAHGLRFRSPDRDVIDIFLGEELSKELADVPPGRLWLYWGGHGSADGRDRHRLLYANAPSPTDLWNLDLDSLLAALTTYKYPGRDEQVILVDACAWPWDRIPDGSSLRGDQPNPGRRQVVVLAARPGDTATHYRAEGSGAFTSALRPHLEKTIPGPLKALNEQLDRFLIEFERNYPDHSIPYRKTFEGHQRYEPGPAETVPTFAERSAIVRELATLGLTAGASPVRLIRAAAACLDHPAWVELRACRNLEAILKYLSERPKQRKPGRTFPRPGLEFLARLRDWARERGHDALAVKVREVLRGWGPGSPDSAERDAFADAKAPESPAGTLTVVVDLRPERRPDGPDHYVDRWFVRLDNPTCEWIADSPRDAAPKPQPIESLRERFRTRFAEWIEPHRGPSGSVAVEFLVPENLRAEAFPAWELTAARRFGPWLGRGHPVAVRCRDRHLDPGYHVPWTTAWNLIHDDPAEPRKLTLQVVPCDRPLSDQDITTLYKSLVSRRGAACLIVDPFLESPILEDVWEAAVGAGVALAMWNRSRDHAVGWHAPAAVGPRAAEEVGRQVFEARSQGKEPAVIWLLDDPTRLVPRHWLAEPGSTHSLGTRG